MKISNKILFMLLAFSFLSMNCMEEDILPEEPKIEDKFLEQTTSTIQPYKLKTLCALFLIESSKPGELKSVLSGLPKEVSEYYCLFSAINLVMYMIAKEAKTENQKIKLPKFISKTKVLCYKLIELDSANYKKIIKVLSNFLSAYKGADPKTYKVTGKANIVKVIKLINLVLNIALDATQSAKQKADKMLISHDQGQIIRKLTKHAISWGLIDILSLC